MSLSAPIHIFDVPQNRELNEKLAEQILVLPDSAYLRCSHFFHGRYENRYLSEASLPGLASILEVALGQAAEILDRPVCEIKFGFWLNIMQQGDVTTLHSHDDDDELLSAVYYLRVPEGAGQFRLHTIDGIKEITPVAGRFMFFDPALPHEVARHTVPEARISIGINFGPANSGHENQAQ